MATNNDTKPTTTLKLEPVTPDDISDITNLWYAAFGTPEMLRIFPDTPGVRRWWDEANRNDLLHKPATRRYLKVVDTAADNRLVAYGKWVLAGVDEDGSRFPPWPADCDARLCDDFFGAMARERKRLLGERKNWCMFYPVVFPICGAYTPYPLDQTM